LSKPSTATRDPAVRLGGVLFRHRGWLPAPLILGIVALAAPSAPSVLAGMALATPFELLRCWAARSIGPASRTRGSTPGPLARAGPYRYSRNPLYVANIALYGCFALAAGWWPALVLPLGAVPYYQLIVRWEEARLEQTHGAAYRELRAQVPRWLGRPGGSPPDPRPHATWSAALRAERGTLVVLLLVFGALGARLLLAG
jgi:protein-S-isoprenylcysteine O-methyltransferase Ste14